MFDLFKDEQVRISIIKAHYEEQSNEQKKTGDLFSKWDFLSEEEFNRKLQELKSDMV